MTKHHHPDDSGEHHHGHQHHHPPVSAPPHKPRDADDGPIARYVEWTEHRYTPGYYVGGRFSPLMRALQQAGPSGRMLGSVMVAIGVLDLLLVAIVARRYSVGDISSIFMLVLMGVLSFATGIRALRRGRGTGSKED